MGRLRAASPAPSSRIRHSAAASARVGDDPVLERAGLGGQPTRARERVGVAAGDLDEQPARAARAASGTALPAGPDEVDDAGVEALAGDQPAAAGRQQRRDRVGGLDHRRVAEHDEQPLRLVARPAAPWPRGRARACPRSRPGTGRRRRPFSGSRCSSE